MNKDNMNNIIYLGHYDTSNNSLENRSYSIAATNKMDYIINAIKENGYSVTIVSASRTRNKKGCKGHVFEKDEKERLVLFPSFGYKGLFSRILRTVQSNCNLLFYFLKNVKKGQPVLVYHSLAFSNIVTILKKIINFYLILEVNELYSDVLDYEKKRKKEIKAIKKANAYLLSTELLDKKININRKPAIINHGTYKVEKCFVDSFNDGKIHIVYAGTLDPRKGGAAAAAAAGSFLSADYHIHILGFGSESEISEIKQIIDDTNNKSSAIVSYDGLKKGEEYSKFLQMCDIGLSTQNPDAAFNATSFPSKILSYMANGLRVVSIRIPAIKGSAIGKYMYYYDVQTPEQIANAISKIDFNDNYNSREIINVLDVGFKKSLGDLLNGRKK